MEPLFYWLYFISLTAEDFWLVTVDSKYTLACVSHHGIFSPSFFFPFLFYWCHEVYHTPSSSMLSRSNK